MGAPAKEGASPRGDGTPTVRSASAAGVGARTAACRAGDDPGPVAPPVLPLCHTRGPRPFPPSRLPQELARQSRPPCGRHDLRRRSGPRSRSRRSQWTADASCHAAWLEAAAAEALAAQDRRYGHRRNSTRGPLAGQGSAPPTPRRRRPTARLRPQGRSRGRVDEKGVDVGARAGMVMIRTPNWEIVVSGGVRPCSRVSLRLCGGGGRRQYFLGLGSPPK